MQFAVREYRRARERVRRCPWTEIEGRAGNRSLPAREDGTIRRALARARLDRVAGGDSDNKKSWDIK